MNPVSRDLMGNWLYRRVLPAEANLNSSREPVSDRVYERADHRPELGAFRSSLAALDEAGRHIDETRPPIIRFKAVFQDWQTMFVPLA
jgi:hypothetical protein